MKPLSRLLALAVFALSSSFLLAQDDEARGPASDGGTIEMMHSITITAAAHAPFSGVVQTEWRQTLEDGSTVTRENHRVVMRDSLGRIFQERRTLVAKGGTEEPELRRIEISDPKRHIKYFCRATDHVCLVHGYAGPPTEEREPENAEVAGKVTITREDVGKSNISGLEVTGTKETRVIEAGALGNDRPITITKEIWYSPQLQMNVMVKRSDPRHGVQTLTMTEVSLAEPDPKYFQLPAGYKVFDPRMNHGSPGAPGQQPQAAEE